MANTTDQQTIKPNNTQQTEISKPAKREFIHVQTALNSRLNKGQDDNIIIKSDSKLAK